MNTCIVYLLLTTEQRCDSTAITATLCGIYLLQSAGNDDAREFPVIKSVKVKLTRSAPEGEMRGIF